MRFEFFKQRQATARALLVTKALINAIKDNDRENIPQELIPYIGTVIKTGETLDNQPIVIVRGTDAVGTGDYLVIDEKGFIRAKAKQEFEEQYERI